MTRCTPLFLLLTLAGSLQAGEAFISEAEVEVRSGPSPVYYITGKLHRGDRVEVQGEPENGYLKIAPPAGSFSLIVKKDVLTPDNKAGVVTTDNAETRMGGMTTTYDRRGAWLPKGAAVTILGEETLPSGQGPVAYYKIVPLNEHRYILATAIKKQPEIIQASGTGPGLGLGDPDRGTPSMSPEVAAKMQAAEQAYRKAEATGEWSEAYRLYKELEQCPNHEARMAAWSRRYFIEQKMAGGRTVAPAAPVSRTGFRDNVAPAAPARFGSSPPAALPNRPRSSYTYATDSAPTRLTPIPLSPTPPGSSASQAKYIPPPAAPAPGSTLLMGKLVRSSQTDINGKPLYLLVDSQGQVKCYVAPLAGQTLERFLQQNVQVQGDGLVYQAYLRNNLVVASDVRPLN